MSNLTDLLPAGGGGKNVNFVASGTLPSGQTVALKTNGQVEAVGGVAQAVGSPVVFEAADSPYVTSTFDSNSNKIVVSYRDDGNSNYGTAVVGTVSGTSISFGTPVVFFANLVSARSVVFDSTNNKIVIGFYYYNGSANIGTAIVGTVSGTSISFGSAVSIAGSSVPTYISLAYDANAQRVVASYRDANNSDYGTAVVGTVSGTSISFGSPVIFNSANSPYIGSTFDSNANKVVISYQDGTSANYGTAIVGTVSGTSISFGTSVVFENTANMNLGGSAVCFDTNTNKILIAYSVYVFNSVQYDGKAVVGTVSGTSISFGSPVVFHAASTGIIGVAYDPDTNKTVITYTDQDNSNYGALVNGTISGTSVSFSSEFVFSAANAGFIAPVYDSNADKTVIFYQDNGNSGYGTGVVYSVASSNNTSFIGITDADIANAASGSVTIKGGISTIKGGTYAVTVVNSGSGNKYAINGVEQSVLNLYEGATYKFDQSSGTNSGHPFRFSTTADGTHGGGSEYTTGVTTSGVPGNAGAYTQIIVASGAPTLYYYCSVHSGMGGTANTLAIVPNSNYYVQNDGTLTTTTSTVLAGRALSSTSINLDYTT